MYSKSVLLIQSSQSPSGTALYAVSASVWRHIMWNGDEPNVYAEWCAAERKGKKEEKQLWCKCSAHLFTRVFWLSSYTAIILSCCPRGGVQNNLAQNPQVPLHHTICLYFTVHCSNTEKEQRGFLLEFSSPIGTWKAGGRKVEWQPPLRYCTHELDELLLMFLSASFNILDLEMKIMWQCVAEAETGFKVNCVLICRNEKVSRYLDDFEAKEFGYQND